MYSLSKKEFVDLASEGNLIPLYREIFADMETPVSAFVKLGGPEAEHSFLLESVEGGEKWGRYTFLGADPSIVYRYKNKRVTLTEQGETKTFDATGDPLHELKKIMDRFTPAPVTGLPRFHGGAVGFLPYDVVRFFERMPEKTRDELDTPDALFVITDSILIFDNISHTVKVVANALVDDAGAEAAYDKATKKIDEIITKLQATPPVDEIVKGDPEAIEFVGNVTQQEHEARVDRCKKYILAGDIFQVVLAQRLSCKISVPAFQIYRALRRVNPSPYMYYLNCGDMKIVGASPESLVRVEEGMVETRPIAGTRPRGKSEEEDQNYEKALIKSEKERAEHIMLVDLGRNDIGRVSEGGTVHVNELMKIERYSHVMHIVSNVQGRLRQDYDAYDALRACFPAGTLSGAPKIRAMEIIEEMELTRRGVYGGAVGYFSYSGAMDVAIAIRTLQIQGDTAYLGAGGGIVADSVPADEYQETINKGKALMTAVKIAENGLEIG